MSNAKLHIDWFKHNEPFIYRVAMKRLQLKNNTGLAGVNQLGAIDWGSVLSSIGSTVKSVATDVAPQYLQYKQQKKIMDMQLDRAKKGLPPANVDDYTPAIKISPQITPESEAAITRVAVQTSESAAKKMLPWLLIGGLGVGYVVMNKKGRR